MPCCSKPSGTEALGSDPGEAHRGWRSTARQQLIACVWARTEAKFKKGWTAMGGHEGRATH
eukprot:401927-Alexandrium_andersonii.AAC.1